ncbi:MAG: hypothetical protein JW908_16350 [Anaerolineales bacterium]|nr:hypothetical protein [Anaerolineales bacterium]
MKDLLVGLDIGTSTVKACLFDLQGNQLAAAFSEQPLSIPQPGWAEQNPEDWWQGVLTILNKIIKEIDVHRIAALGLSGQCPGHVLVDAHGASLGPAIIWRDQRAVEEAQWISEHIASNPDFTWTGITRVVDATLPPARLRWLSKHRLQTWAQASSIMQPKDYIGLRLTGEVATDLYSAYSLVDPQTGRYDSRYFTALEIPLDKMPKVLTPESLLGHVTRQAANLCGLLPGTPIYIGTIDAWCDNIACGASLESRAVDIAGTSEIISLGVNRKLEAEGIFLAELSSQDKFLCGPTQFGSSTIKWLVDIFYSEMGERIDFNILEETASQAPSGSDGLVFLPYLSGERAPIWDAQARGGFIGLTSSHTRSHFVRAVYEGVGFAVRHVLETCEQAAGLRAAFLVICGGGSRSRFWNQIKADVLQRPVFTTVNQVTACLGAAMLAGVGAGYFKDIHHACQSMTRLGEPIEPRSAVSGCYENNFQIYKNLYPALQPLFQKTICFK